MSAPIPVFGDRPKAVATPKLRALVKYPGNILGGTGIDVTKANGTVTVDMQWNDFGAISAIPTSPTSNILTFDTATNEYVMVPSHLLGGAASGIADAPNDGIQYGRQSAAWTPTATAGSNFLQAGTGAITRTMQDKARERVSALDFGADNTGVVECHAQLQAWLDYLMINGGMGYLPAGDYRISTGLVINGNVTTGAERNRVDLLGDGSGNTRIIWAGSAGTALYYRGSTSTAPGAFGGHIQIEKLQILGNRLADGLQLRQCAEVALRDCLFLQNNFGLRLVDVLEAGFFNCSMVANNAGLVAYPQNVFDPTAARAPINDLSFFKCEIAGNMDAGADIIGATTVNFFGGAIEGSGQGSAASQRWGIRIDNTRTHDVSGVAHPFLVDGPVAANFYGVYFETNCNVADIWFIAGGAGNGATSLNVQGCIFDRNGNDPTLYVGNNIRMDLNGGSTGDKARLNITGNGFVGLNGYVPSASRPYVVVNSTGSNNWNVVDLGNTYTDNIEKPNFPGPVKSDDALATCYVAFNGTNLIMGQSFNVASLTRNAGPGAYRITFRRPMANFTYIVVGSLNASGSVCVADPHVDYVDIVTVAPDGTHADAANVNVIIFGSGDLT